MVIWLIGLAGSGKTTIGREVYRQWKMTAPNTVLVDGDEIRKIFGHDQGPHCYTVEGRRQNAERIAEICAWLDRQQVNVVCCILSIFRDVERRNRQIYSRYFEVFIDAPLDIVIKRDTKNLYGPALRGEMRNVVGVDIEFKPPVNPDMVIDNRADGLDFGNIARDVLTRAGMV
jgi:adenylylsulfate kinase-like enzyme